MILVEKEAESVVILVENEALGAVNEPDISSANCAEALNMVFSNSVSATVILVEKEEESDTKFVILVENEALGAEKDPDISSANCAEALIIVSSNSTSAVVILVEKEAESDTKFVIRVEKLALGAVNEPLISSAN